MSATNDFSDSEIYDAMQDGADDECYECGGEGYLVDDCFEDTCCCADPETEHGIIPCPNCGGEIMSAPTLHQNWHEQLIRLNRGGFDIEVCIGPDGRIESAVLGREELTGRPAVAADKEGL